LQASAPDALVDLAARGVGAAILSASMVGGDPRLHAVAIDDVPAPAVLSLVRAPGGNPALDAFERYAREAFGLAAAAPAHPS
jgi:DNA-binding transcriptional LysR family regulator